MEKSEVGECSSADDIELKVNGVTDGISQPPSDGDTQGDLQTNSDQVRHTLYW